MGKNNKNTPVVNATTGVQPGQSSSAQQISAADKAEADKAAADKAAADKAEADKAAADKATADKASADKAAADKAAADQAAAATTHEAEIIPPGKFIAENGNEYELVVSSFTFQGKTYSKEEALSEHPDVLEHLASVKSFILKKV